MTLFLACDVVAARKLSVGSEIMLPHTQIILLGEGNLSIEFALGLLTLSFIGISEYGVEPVTVKITLLEQLG